MVLPVAGSPRILRKPSPRNRLRRLLLMLCVLGSCHALPLAARNLSLVWDPNVETDLSHYVVYYGAASRDYTNSFNVGKVTNATVSGLLEDVTYFFAVTAVNEVGLESDPSEEVSHLFPSNDPYISTIANHVMIQGSTRSWAFTVAPKTPLRPNLTLSATSSNPEVVSATNIIFSGAGPDRLATITAGLDVAGVTLITITVSDGEFRAEARFALTVKLANDPPIVSPVINQRTGVGRPRTDIPFTVADDVTPVGNLTFSATSSNPEVLPDEGIRFGGSGQHRSVTLLPAPEQAGRTTVTIFVSDGELVTTTGFTLEAEDRPPPAPDLTAHWTFDEIEGPMVVDAAGENFGTLFNDVSRVSGVSGGAVSFHGAGQEVVVADSETIRLRAAFSVSVWIQPAAIMDAGSGRQVLLKKDGSYGLVLNHPADDGKLSFFLNNGSPSVRSLTTEWKSNQWYHIAITSDGSILRFFVNGVLESSLAANSQPRANMAPLEMGGPSESGHYFSGAIDEVRLYRTALSRSRIQELHAEGAAHLPPPPVLALNQFGPIISAVNVDTLAPDRARIVWATAVPATAWVEYGLTTAEEQPTTANTVPGLRHSAWLASLQPRSTYSFRIHAEDADGNPCVSPDYQLTTPAPTIGSKFYLPVALASGVITPPMILSEDPLATDGTFLTSPLDGQGTVTVPFQIPAAGDYFIWARSLFPEVSRNSFFLSVDGGEEFLYDGTEALCGSSWTWSKVNEASDHDTTLPLPPYLLPLVPGAHQLIIRANEAFAGLDRVLITNDPDFVPVDDQPVGGIASALSLTNPVIQLVLVPGWNCIANPLYVADGALPVLPEESFLFKFDARQQRYISYVLEAGAWNPSVPSFHPGEGFMLWNVLPVPTTLSFTGAWRLDLPSRPPEAGFNLLAARQPRAGRVTELLEFPLEDGARIYRWNDDKEKFIFSEFKDGAFAVEPFIEVGEAFFLYQPASP